MWPGFGENMRVLQWVFERCRGKASAVETSLGEMPRFEDLEWRGLEKLSRAQYAELEGIDSAAWKAEFESHDELFGKLGDRLPRTLEAHRGQMRARVTAK
jgi:phosphoenolpyruvate carboxykinase (GTP)